MDTGVSIVITTFNHARFLGEAISSALRQTTPPAEIIVVDDGSTDHPEAVVQAFPRVRLVRQTNQGLSAARNTGLRTATSPFVIFLDADDRLLPVAIESALTRMTASPDCGFVYGAHRLIDEEGNLIQPVPFKDGGKQAYTSFLAGNCVGMHATVMYRRDRLEQSGEFDQSLRACEDYDVYLRMARLFPVACGPEIVADYRKHGSNMSRNAPMMLRAALKVLRRQKRHARQAPEDYASYGRGIAEWKEYYVTLQVQTLRADWLGRRMTLQLIRESAATLVLAPSTFLRIMRAQFWEGWNKRVGSAT